MNRFVLQTAAWRRPSTIMLRKLTTVAVRGPSRFTRTPFRINNYSRQHEQLTRGVSNFCGAGLRRGGEEDEDHTNLKKHTARLTEASPSPASLLNTAFGVYNRVGIDSNHTIKLNHFDLPRFYSDDRRGSGAPGAGGGFLRRHRQDQQQQQQRPTRTRVAERRSAREQRRVGVQEAERQYADPPARDARSEALRDRWEQEQRDRSAAPFGTETQLDELERIEGVKPYIAKVYGYVGGALGVAFLGTALPMALLSAPINPIIPGLASLVPLFGMNMTSNCILTLFVLVSPTTRFAMFGTFAFLSGMTLPYLVSIAMAVNPMAIPMALGATTGMFGLMSMLALAAPPGKLLALGPPLFGAVLAGLGLSIASMFIPSLAASGMTQWFLTYGMLGVFALYTAFDTQNMINDYKEGIRDPLSHATGFFIDFMAMFKRFLFIFLSSNDD